MWVAVAYVYVLLSAYPAQQIRKVADQGKVPIRALLDEAYRWPHLAQYQNFRLL